MKDLSHYKQVASLFEYPDAEFVYRVSEVIKILQERCPEAGAEVQEFFELLPKDDLEKMRELFTRSFDVQSLTTLDLGYVLFGDDYKRGEMLANLNREHIKVGNDLKSELADHLPNVLRLLPKLEDKELLIELVENIIAPALRIMDGEFSPDRVEMKNKAYKKHYKTLIETPPEIKSATLYRHIIRALHKLLKVDFSFTEKPAFGVKSDFLKSITRENDIEAKAESFV